MSLAYVLGTLSILSYLLASALVVTRQPATAVLGISKNLPLFALPLLALLSTGWSDYPDMTLRGSIQFMVTTIVGIAVGYCVKPRHLISALFSALAFIVLLCVTMGRWETAFFADQYALVGLFGSKNQMGLISGLMLVTTATVLFDRFQPLPFRVLAIFAMPLGVAALVLSLSTGALIVSIIAIAVIPLLRLISRLSPLTRFAVFASGVLLLVAGVTLSSFVDLAVFLNLVGKDSSFTGRTAFWDIAYSSILENPILGSGYEAFWQPGVPGAERLWGYWGITGKTGLHFHNTFIHITVDLGLVGLFVLLMTFAAIFVRIFSTFITGLSAERIFAISIFVFLFLRTPVEVDMLFQFSFGTALLCFVWIYLTPTRHLFLLRLPARSVGLRRWEMP